MTILAKILATILFIIPSVVIIASFYLLARNDRVCDFRLYILDLNPNKIRACIKLYKKYSYKQMLYSFKPLRLECWFTEEELRTIE